MQERSDRVKSQWGSISGRIPGDISPYQVSLIRDYYRAQLHVANNKPTKAKNILNALDNKLGFLELEENKPELFVAIDIAAKSISNRKDLKGNSIEPLFRI